MTTLKDVRAHWSHERAVSGHKASFAAAALFVVGVTAGSCIEDAKEVVDRSELKAYSGSVYSVGTASPEHTFGSGALIGLSALSIFGAFGFSVRAGDRYIRSAEHRNGSKDHLYDPRSYDA